MNKSQVLAVGVGVMAIAAGGFLISRGGRTRAGSAPAPDTLQIVAAENFWGSLASQLAGPEAHVMSVLSDPNADPHEYESSAGVARVFAEANYVIVNGAGYDSWSGKLLAASSSPQRRVLDVAALLGQRVGDNPHFWYDPVFVNEVVAQMAKDLGALKPAKAAFYQQQLQLLEASLAGYQSRIAELKRQFGGTKLAATENVFGYTARAAGLDLISPPQFMKAVAEGNEPPAQGMIEFQRQLESREPAVLVYNRQTSTPVTESMKKLAMARDIPVLGITETVQPPGARFQDWMDAEIESLQNALNASAQRQRENAQR